MGKFKILLKYQILKSFTLILIFKFLFFPVIKNIQIPLMACFTLIRLNLPKCHRAGEFEKYQIRKDKAANIETFEMRQKRKKGKI